MLKYTPAPWITPHFVDNRQPCKCTTILSDNYAGGIAIVLIDNGHKIDNGGNDCPPLKEAQANAHILTNAPLLLEAIELLLFEDSNISDSEHVKNRLFAASVIAKARGKEL